MFTLKLEYIRFRPILDQTECSLVRTTASWTCSEWAVDNCNMNDQRDAQFL